MHFTINITDDHHILGMVTVVHTHSIMWTGEEGLVSTSALNILQQDVCSTGSTAWGAYDMKSFDHLCVQSSLSNYSSKVHTDIVPS